jgi:hypothetical protein
MDCVILEESPKTYELNMLFAVCPILVRRPFVEGYKTCILAQSP